MSSLRLARKLGEEHFRPKGEARLNFTGWGSGPPRLTGFSKVKEGLYKTKNCGHHLATAGILLQGFRVWIFGGVWHRDWDFQDRENENKT